MAALTGWFGGKNSMSNWIYKHIPKDIKTYVEVFSGSMAIYFNEDFTHCENIVFNDFNSIFSPIVILPGISMLLLSEVRVLLEKKFIWIK